MQFIGYNSSTDYVTMTRMISFFTIVILFTVDQSAARLQTGVTETSVSLTWDPSVSSHLYLIKFQPASDPDSQTTLSGATFGVIEKCFAVGTLVCARLSPLSPGTQYDIVLVADGSVEYERSVWTDPAKPAWPPSDDHTINLPQATVTWVLPQGQVKHYVVTVQVKSTGAKNEHIAPEAHFVLDVTAGENYIVLVKSVNGNDIESGSIVTGFTIKPASVEVATITFDDSDPDSVKCTWSKPATVADQYLVSLVNPPSGVSVTPETVDFSSATREVTISGLTSGSVTVQLVVKSLGERSDPSQKTYQQRPTAIDASTFVIDDTDPANIVIRWIKPETTATAYVVEISPNTPLANVQIGALPEFSDANPEVTVSGLLHGQKIEVVFIVVSSGVESDSVAKSYVRAPILTAKIYDTSPKGLTDQLILAYTANEPYFDSISVQQLGMNAPGTNPASVTDRRISIGGLQADTEYVIEYWVTSHGVKSEIKTNAFYTAPSRIQGLRTQIPGERRMNLIWSPVDDQSVVRLKCANAAQFSQEVNPPNSRVELTGMEAYTEYFFEVTVVKHGKTSHNVQIDARTAESSPSPVLNFTVTLDQANPSTHAQFSWGAPAEPRGLLESYLLLYRGNSTEQFDTSIHEGEIRFSSVPGKTQYTEIVDKFKGGRNYRITMYAVNGKGSGEGVERLLATHLGLPKLLNTEYRPESQPERVKENSVGIRFKNVFNDKNGPIHGYSVIVYEDQDGSRVSLDRVATWREVQAGTGPWGAYYATKECNIFKSASLCEGRTKSMGARQERSTDEEITFEIGSENCTRAKMDDICNGPLLQNRTYRATLRGHTAAGYMDTQPSQPFSAGRRPPPAVEPEELNLLPFIAGGIAAVVIIVVVIAIVVYCRSRRKESNKSSIDQHSARARMDHGHSNKEVIYLEGAV